MVYDIEKRRKMRMVEAERDRLKMIIDKAKLKLAENRARMKQMRAKR